MIKCILFDLDGVLVEACEWHRISLNKTLLEISNIEITESEHFTTFNGLPTKNKLELLVKQDRINPKDCDLIFQQKQKYTKEIIANALPDIEKIKMHSYIKNLNIKLACITNSIMETAKLMLETTGQFQFMDLIISNEQVRYPKPHGEGYIRAMINFGIQPENTLIVEDSEVGLTAAHSTGANIWQVKNSQEVNLENLKRVIHA